MAGFGPSIKPILVDTFIELLVDEVKKLKGINVNKIVIDDIDESDPRFELWNLKQITTKHSLRYVQFKKKVEVGGWKKCGWGPREVQSLFFPKCIFAKCIRLACICKFVLFCNDVKKCNKSPDFGAFEIPSLGMYAKESLAQVEERKSTLQNIFVKCK